MKRRFSRPILVMIIVGSLLMVVFNSYIGAMYSNVEEEFLGGSSKPAPKDRKMYIGDVFGKCKMSAADKKTTNAQCASASESNAQTQCQQLNEEGKELGVSCVGINSIPLDPGKAKSPQIFYPMSNLPQGCMGPQNQNYVQGLKGIPMKTVTYKDPETGENKKYGAYNCDAPAYSKYKPCCLTLNKLNGPNNYDNSLSDSKDPTENLNSYDLGSPKADWATSKISWLAMFSKYANKMFSVPYKPPSKGGSSMVGMP